jgi:ankyrin repeat protein
MRRISLAGIIFVMLFVLMSTTQAQSANLWDAASAGDLAKVKQLLELGANVNTRNMMQYTPAMTAEMFGNTKLAKMLCKAGGH